MRKPYVFMFSGQGSQYFHMGKALYEHHAIFKFWMDRLNSLVLKDFKYSVLAKIYETSKKPSEDFNCTLYTHLAIFMVEYALYQTLLAENVYPDIVLGTSLGELTAAAVADILSYEEALYLIIKQAQSFTQLCQPGSMLTILGDLKHYHDCPEVSNITTLAATNFQGHFTLAGGKEQIKIVADIMQKKGVNNYLLPVLSRLAPK